MSNNRSNTYCHKSGAQKRKDAKDRIQQSLHGVSKLSSYFTPIVQTNNGTSEQVDNSTHSEDAFETVLNAKSNGSRLEDEMTTQSTTKSGTSSLDAFVEVQPSNMTMDNLEFSNDLATWPKKLPLEMQEYWIKNGPRDCQHKDHGFKESATRLSSETHQRHCSLSLFTRVHTRTNEHLNRTWLCYSSTSGCVYCFACKLMSNKISPFTSGFNNWKHGKELVTAHENSQQHRDSMVALYERKATGGHVNNNLVKLFENEKGYWRQLLQRIVSVVQFLCARGLAFRGKDERIGSPSNGNYLGTLELLSRYDTFLAEHIRKYANKGRGHTSYLSSTICEEIIRLMGQKVLSVIVTEIKAAKYYSISIDSTPDIMHVDQLTIVIRYVLPSGPVERFVEFIPMFGHTGEEMANIVLSFLEKNDIAINDCRGQSYDNAANMSGKYNGVQDFIRERCPYADYVPCTAHSLNLVGTCAAACCSAAVEFFDVLQGLYAWLVASPYRWRKHRQKLAGLPVHKALSNTRWSARYDAVNAINKGYHQNVEMLEEFSKDQEQAQDSRVQAEGFKKKLQQLETAILLEVWDTILQQFQKTSLSLQEAGLSLNSALSLIESLLKFVERQRTEFDRFEEKGKIKCSANSYIGDEKRQTKRKRQFDEGGGEDVVLAPREKFKVQIFLAIIDQLCLGLRSRLDAYQVVHKKFGFLSNLEHLSTVEIKAASANLVKEYQNDLEDCLDSELMQFVSLYKAANADVNTERTDIPTRKKESIELRLFLLLNDNDWIETFPNVNIALRIYLCMMVSNCSGERSFSKLKRIKNELRSTMVQERLSNLSLMSIEHEILNALDFEKLIDAFAANKARRTAI